MVAGLREGKGIYYFVDGRVYKGEWVRDKKEGYGSEEGRNLYEGEWVRDMKWGAGKMVFQDGSKYEGYFERDLPNGEGSY